uniref:TSC22 domain family member 3 n=1 Tax=Strix occidentalis caurina TaxID=311401 RepID=A0A8D0FUT0_STROC
MPRECRSPVGLDCCSCCLDLANRSGLEEGAGGENNNLGSPTVSSFRQLQEQLVRKNLNTDKLSSIMRQDSLEPVVRDPCYLFNQGICNRNIDQTLLSILLLFHRWVSPTGAEGGCPVCWVRPEPDQGWLRARELATGRMGARRGACRGWQGRDTRMTLDRGTHMTLEPGRVAALGVSRWGGRSTSGRAWQGAQSIRHGWCQPSPWVQVWVVLPGDGQQCPSIGALCLSGR